MPQVLYDLLYMDGPIDYNKAKQTALTFAEGVMVRDASDEIHRYRLAVAHDSVERDAYVEFLIREGLWQFSFIFQLMRMEEPERLRALLERVKAQQPDH